MSVLKEKQTWKRAKKRRAFDLSADEQACVREAVRVLRIRMGSLAAVADAMGTAPKAIEKLTANSGKPSPGLALQVARLAGVAVEDVLTGRFPVPGSCPMCGRHDSPTE